MADKYIWHGATFSGDGTSPNAATSDGGVGAWNNINISEGTAPAFGTLVAGDTVYIRSKDAAGADITRTMTAAVNFGSTAATVVAFITWVIDNGVVWPGVDGTITYTHASNFLFTIRANNRLVCRRRGAHRLINTAANPAAGAFLLALSGEAFGIGIDASAKTGTNEYQAVNLLDDAHLESPLIVWGVQGGISVSSRGLIQLSSASKKMMLVDPDIELRSSGPGFSVFRSISRGMLTVIGGRVWGAGATTGQALFTGATQSRFRSIGLRFPRQMDVVPPANVGLSIAPAEVEVIGCDDGVGGHIDREWGYATSRTDANPPTLQAWLPDSLNTPWAWRVYPKTASDLYPLHLSAAKMIQGVSGVKTITQEILVASTMPANRSKLWLTVEYIDDATGEPRHLTTRDWGGGAIEGSSANWSSTVWGVVSFNKHKLSVVTPTPVKQNSIVLATLWSTLTSASADDIYFVDPDFGVI